MIYIVLISGKQGSGKTTLSDALIKLGRTRFDHVTNLKFASPLYELQEYILNRMERFTGVARKQKDGRLLQLLGTEWGRNEFGPNIWVDIVQRQIIHLRGSWRPEKRILVVIDDCRFENEFTAFADDDNCFTIRLEAPEEVRKERTNSWRNDTGHASEVGLDEFAEEGYFDAYEKTGPGGRTPEAIAQSIVNYFDHNEPTKPL